MASTSKEKPLGKAERIRIIAALAAAVLLLAAAAAIWYFRDRLFSGEIPLLSAAGSDPGVSFVYDPGSGQCFAAAGKNLALASESSFSLLSPEGDALCFHAVSFQTPAVVAGEDYAVFFDLDGQSLWFVWPEGSESQYDCEGEILSVRLSESGHLALCSRTPGWQGLVTVLDARHREVYRWYCADDYILSARVSPDGRRLAVLCLNGSGSVVRFFSLLSETQQAAFSASNTLFTDFFWLSGDELCAVSDAGAVFFSSEGAWTAAYDFSDRYLSACDAGSGFVCLALSPYRSGGNAAVAVLDGGGKELSVVELGREILSLDAEKNEFLVLDTGAARLYGSGGNLRGTLSDVTGFKQALIRNKGEALLLAAGFAEVYKY